MLVDGSKNWLHVVNGESHFLLGTKVDIVRLETAVKFQPYDLFMIEAKVNKTSFGFL